MGGYVLVPDTVVNILYKQDCYEGNILIIGGFVNPELGLNPRIIEPWDCRPTTVMRPRRQ